MTEKQEEKLKQIWNTLTDKEKAEYILLQNDCYTYKGNFIRADKVVDLVSQGLAKGRKESEKDKGKLIDENAELKKENEALINENNILVKGLGCETCSITDEYKNLNSKIAELEKKINTLKIKNASLQKKNGQQAKQIEKMKNKLNCAKYHYCLCKDKVCEDCKDWKIESR